jgi:hypothetical protein
MRYSIGQKYLFSRKFLAKIYAKQEEMSAAAEKFYIFARFLEL